MLPLTALRSKLASSARAGLARVPARRPMSGASHHGHGHGEAAHGAHAEVAHSAEMHAYEHTTARMFGGGGAHGAHGHAAHGAEAASSVSAVPDTAHVIRVAPLSKHWPELARCGDDCKRLWASLRFCCCRCRWRGRVLAATARPGVAGVVAYFS